MEDQLTKIAVQHFPGVPDMQFVAFWFHFKIRTVQRYYAQHNVEQRWKEAFSQEAHRILHARTYTGWHDMTEVDWNNARSATNSIVAREVNHGVKAMEEALERKRLKEVGQRFTLWTNQGERTASSLAFLGEEALIEYSMPRGTSALRIVNRDEPGGGRNMSYFQVPVKWLREMVETGVEWIGCPQQSNEWAPSVAQAYEERRKTFTDRRGERNATSELHG